MTLGELEAQVAAGTTSIYMVVTYTNAKEKPEKHYCSVADLQPFNRGNLLAFLRKVQEALPEGSPVKVVNLSAQGDEAAFVNDESRLVRNGLWTALTFQFAGKKANLKSATRANVIKGLVKAGRQAPPGATISLVLNNGKTKEAYTAFLHLE